MSSTIRSCLRRVSRLLVRGPDAPQILADLEEAFERDLTRGLTPWSALWRYATNVLGSAANTWRPARWLVPGGAWLDLKLGARMLRKQPVITVVAVLTLALGIPVGLLPLHVVNSLTAPLPVEDPDGIVRVWNWDTVVSRPVSQPLHDLVRWREELTSFEGLGMVRRGEYNVISEDGRAGPVRGAQVSASVFELLRVQPVLGRTLDTADEVVGAPSVVVIGHDVWRSRLAGDPDVVGSTIRIGAELATVVGVMPESFLFPVNDQLWLPFRYDALQYASGEGPVGWVMGRLGEGVSLEEARTEAAIVGGRMALEFPDTHARLQPQIVPYTEAPVPGIDRPEGLELLVVQLLLLVLLALACCNVGVLILARTATRTGEIAVRTALGASRSRIVSQIFAESFVLAIASAGVGLLGGQFIATRFNTLWPALPYWVTFDIKGRTVLLALSLAVLSAAIAGVVPALKATGRNVQASMQRAGRGGSGVRFGTMSSALIVAQVAVAVLCLGLGSSLVPTVVDERGGVGIEADQYLSASVRLPRPAVGSEAASADPAAYRADFEDRLRETHEELSRRLAAESGVGAVAIASALPGMSHLRRRVEVEGEPLPSGSRGYPVRTASVDMGYFRALEAPIRTGRGFGTADLGGERSAIIVNSTFVDRVLGGRQPLGRRVRYVAQGRADPSPWYEIVGVVGHLGMNELNPDLDEGIYHPIAAGELHPVRFALRVGPEPRAFVPRLRALVAEVDPSAIVRDSGPLDEVFNYDKALASWGLIFVAFTSWVTVLLSGAGLYALMSFTVAERRREIGIRTALGAPASSVVAVIVRRAFAQLLLGVSVGGALASLMLWGVKPGGDVLQVTNWPVTVPLIAFGVLVVGMLACVSPTRKGLGIPPLEALRS